MQVVESMYSCVVLALHVLATFCPEVGVRSTAWLRAWLAPSCHSAVPAQAVPCLVMSVSICICQIGRGKALACCGKLAKGKHVPNAVTQVSDTCTGCNHLSATLTVNTYKHNMHCKNLYNVCHPYF